MIRVSVSEVDAKQAESSLFAIGTFLKIEDFRFPYGGFLRTLKKY